MIYFVDEDVVQLKAFRTELKMRGYEVVTYENADKALEALGNATDVDLVILDVMLAASPEINSNYFNVLNTNSFMETGLVLLEELISRNPNIFPKKVLLFSMASNSKVVSKIAMVAKKYGILYLKKRDYWNVIDFGDAIEKIINDNR